MSEGNRRSKSVTVEAVASGGGLFPLKHPALTPMPLELRDPKNRGESPRSVELSGVVAVRRGRRSGLDAAAPWAWRAANTGQAVELKHHLQTARDLVESGWTLLEVVADGTLWGWRTRMALSTILGEALANWDGRKGRTKAERLALLTRALEEIEPAQPLPTGGWTVTNGGDQ